MFLNMRTNRSDDGVDEHQRAFANPSLPLAVVVASTRWDEPPRMRHDITHQLMRWFNVLFVEFFPTEKPDQNRISWRQVSERLLIYTPRAPVCIPPRLYANDPLTHKVVNLYFKKLIVDAVGRVSCEKPILFNFVYHYPEIMTQNLFAYKAYICYDEFPKMQRRAHKRNALKTWYQATLFQRYENQVARRANRCFTPHYPLREKLAKVNGNVDMLFHAHDYPLTSPDTPREKTGTINVGYAGYLNWRLLPDWLLAVLRQKDMNLYLIGPIERTYDLSVLETYPSLNYVPPLSQEQLMQKLGEMSVLIMPYDPAIPEVSILTTNSKIFQYIATCKPIVISDLPHYIEFPHGVIYKAKDQADFVTQIRKAYGEDCEEYVSLRRRIASENTWDRRGDELFELLKQELPFLHSSGMVRA